MLSREFRIQKSAAAAAAEPAEKGEADGIPHELTNIRVQEVSLVDRAANRRKFIIAKRDKKAAKGAKADNDVEVVDAADLVDLTTTSKSELPGADLDRADALRLKAEKEAEEAAEAEAEKKLTGGAGDPPVEEPKSEPEKEPAPDPVVEEPVVEPKKEPTKEPAEDPDKTPGVVVDPITIVEELTAKAEEEVAKVGRPMRRERLDRVKAAVKQLADILCELDSEEAPAEKAEKKPVEAPAPAPIVAPVVDTTKADANAAEIKRLGLMVESLQKMVKDQGEQLAKSQRPADSNTISLEKSNNDHDKVYWDRDLAAPIARLKGRSF